MSEEKRYGEKILSEFDVEKDLEVWENKHERDYKIKITLPEFCCLCPRSGYPDFATIYLEYMPDKFVVELKALKLYINSFMNKNISHEDSINEIYGVLESKLKPKFMKITGDFNPRGNVHTVIEISSQNSSKCSFEPKDNGNLNFVAVENTIAATYNEPKFQRKNFDKRQSKSRDTKRDERRPTKFSENGFKKDKFQDKSKRSGSKEGFKKPQFSGEKLPRVVKKDR